jgi:nucleoside-diphosphate-sugar epimerase
LVEQLEQRSESLRLLDLMPAPEGAPGSGSGRSQEHVFIQGDAADPVRMDEAARGVEVIYHLAAAQRMKPQFSSWSEQEIFERNLESVRCVLRAAERHGVPKVVFVSSSGVYGLPESVPCSEDHPKNPLGDYGRSKLAAEELCLEAVEHGLDVTVLRPMSLFGTRMTGIFVMLFEWVRTGRPVYMLGRGHNRVQAVSARDVASACWLAAERPEACGAVLNLGSEPGGVPTVVESVRALIAHAGTGSSLVRIPASLLRTAARGLNLFGFSPIVPEHYLLADREFILDIEAAREKLGWQPRDDNVAMMLDAYDWYVSADESWRPESHPMLRLLDRLVPLRSFSE